MCREAGRRAAALLIALMWTLGAGSSSFAQQNLFNVPSAEITPPKQIFFQQQFNVNRSTQANSTLSYGLGRNMEIGLNIFSVGLIPEEGQKSDPAPPLFLVNFQKVFEPSERFKFGLGTQIGQESPDPREIVHFANFSYLTAAAKLPDDRGKLYAGTYFANDAYRGGRGGDFGFMLGYDIPVIEGKFNLVGDYVSGTSLISVFVLGGVFSITENWQLSLGAQIPSPHSHNFSGGVVELTYVPKVKRTESSEEEPNAYGETPESPREDMNHQERTAPRRWFHGFGRGLLNH